MRLTMRWLALAATAAIAVACGGDDDDNGGSNPPATPTGLTATAAGAAIDLGWNAVTGATSYRLERADATAPGVFAQVGGAITGTSYSDAAVVSDRVYSYRVAAVNTGGQSAFSSVVTASIAGARVRTINADIRADQTWYADTVYTLSGYIKVQPPAVLTIQPGTVIQGDPSVPGSSLWIRRGARIEANGTAAQPIVFTSALAPGSRRPGDWGGIVIVGNGIINRTANPVLTEGGAAGVAENYAGGTNNADNSGTLRYVRIEFAGYDISNGAGQELNALSMYAVGSGTRVEYVQTLAGLDDSFEWWGGAVDGRYLISTETGDDHFDWTEGYRGRNQFLIAYQSTRLDAVPPGTPATDPRGIEADGCDTQGAPDCPSSLTSINAPYSLPVFANFALIGPRTLVPSFPTDGNGVVMRRGTGGMLDRGIVVGWPGRGLQGRDAFTDSLRLRDSLSITNMVLGENAGGDYDAAGADVTGSESSRRFFQATKFATSNHRTGGTVGSLFTATPSGTSIGDFRPPAGALSSTIGTEVVPSRLAGRVAGFPYAGGWATTPYVGPAATGGTAWWETWTRYGTN
ncbi:MAG: fibronectin type III domain-containing protein [Gemmatimonadales bacterium]|jgi:hypothetical protein|nr:fibronectin type III domain-containing protein [Gemmatimonadales bacterium]